MVHEEYCMGYPRGREMSSSAQEAKTTDLGVEKRSKATHVLSLVVGAGIPLDHVARKDIITRGWERNQVGASSTVAKSTTNPPQRIEEITTRLVSVLKVGKTITDLGWFRHSPPREGFQSIELLPQFRCLARLHSPRSFSMLSG
jgi:hypothetical protein